MTQIIQMYDWKFKTFAAKDSTGFALHIVVIYIVYIVYYRMYIYIYKKMEQIYRNKEIEFNEAIRVRFQKDMFKKKN